MPMAGTRLRQPPSSEGGLQRVKRLRRGYESARPAEPLAKAAGPVMTASPAMIGASAQTGVDLLQRRGAGAERLFVQRIQRRLDGVEMGMQVFSLRIDVQQSGDDLALGGVLLQEILRAEAIMR